MRIASGILTIIGGFMGGFFWVGKLPIDSLEEIYQASIGVLMMIPMFLALIGGYHALTRNRWNWALAGAICSMMLPYLGIPALILLIMRRSEFSR